MLQELYPNVTDVHAAIDKMSDKEYAAFFKKVVERLREKNARKRKKAKYLRTQGQTAKAEQLEREADADDQQVEVAAE